MRITAGWVLAASLFLACSGDSGSDSRTPTDPGDDTPEQPEQPTAAEVIVVSADRSHTGIHEFGNELVTVHLRNTGGPGVYKLEFWGLPQTPNGADTFFGGTEPVEVPSGYEESPSWEVPSGSEPNGIFLVQWILVFTRDQGSAQYRQTARFDFP
jgi:hypothetical protein